MKLISKIYFLFILTIALLGSSDLYADDSSATSVVAPKISLSPNDVIKSIGIEDPGSNISRLTEQSPALQIIVYACLFDEYLKSRFPKKTFELDDQKTFTGTLGFAVPVFIAAITQRVSKTEIEYVRPGSRLSMAYGATALTPVGTVSGLAWNAYQKKFQPLKFAASDFVRVRNLLEKTFGREQLAEIDNDLLAEFSIFRLLSKYLHTNPAPDFFEFIDDHSIEGPSKVLNAASLISTLYSDLDAFAEANLSSPDLEFISFKHSIELKYLAREVELSFRNLRSLNDEEKVSKSGDIYSLLLTLASMNRLSPDLWSSKVVLSEKLAPHSINFLKYAHEPLVDILQTFLDTSSVDFRGAIESEINSLSTRYQRPVDSFSNNKTFQDLLWFRAMAIVLEGLANNEALSIDERNSRQKMAASFQSDYERLREIYFQSFFEISTNEGVNR